MIIPLGHAAAVSLLKPKRPVTAVSLLKPPSGSLSFRSETATWIQDSPGNNSFFKSKAETTGVVMYVYLAIQYNASGFMRPPGFCTCAGNRLLKLKPLCGGVQAASEVKLAI